MNPHRPPTTRIIGRLKAGQEKVVDESYVIALRRLHEKWGLDYGSAGLSDRHTETTFGFASKDRDPNFRDGDYSFATNTLLSLESDEAAEILAERGGHYFPDRKKTLGALFDDGQMRFITADEHDDDTPIDPDTVVATGRVTVGMLIDSYFSRGWTDTVDDLLD